MLNSKRILAVDDESDVLMIVRTALESEGAEVETASNGHDALALAAEKDFDLFVLDVMMPEIDGFEVLRRLKENAKTQATPVVMLTGLSEKGVIKKAIDQGVHHYVVKPFEFPEFMRVVSQAISETASDDIMTL